MNYTVTRTEDEGQPTTLHIEFSEPVPYGSAKGGGGQITELLLREPTARQVRDAEREYTVDAPWAGAVAYELKLVSLVAGLSPVAADALPVGAANIAAAFLQEFVEKGAAAVADGDEDLAAEAPEPVSLDIHPAIKFLGAEYVSLEMREPLASEIRRARQMMRTAGSLFESRRAQMALVTAVSGHPAPVIDALPISILNEASRVLGRFTMAGRRTGKP